MLVKLSLYDAESHGLNLMELRPGTCTCMHALETTVFMCVPYRFCVFVCLLGRPKAYVVTGWVGARLYVVYAAGARRRTRCVCVLCIVRACACVHAHVCV